MKRRKKHSSSHTHWYIAGGILAAILVLLCVTCPSEEDHHNAIKKVITNVIDEEVVNNTSDRQVGLRVISSMIASKAVDMTLKAKLDVQNYFIFNKGKIRIKGEDKTISYGILGYVFTFNEQQLKEEVSNATGIQ